MSNEEGQKSDFLLLISSWPIKKNEKKEEEIA